MTFYTTGRQTASAGTEITTIAPAVDGRIPILRGLSYTAGSTAHNAYVMSCRGVTTVAEFAAAGDTTIELAKADPGRTTAGEFETLAANDWIAYETRYGDIEIREVSSISGSIVTIAATTRMVDIGARVWAFYQVGGLNSVQVPLAASTQVDFDNLMIQGGVNRQQGKEHVVTGVNMPLLVVVDNATNAGVLNYASFEWVEGSSEYYS